MGGAHHPEGGLEKDEDFLHSMPQLQTGELKLAGRRTHIFARGGGQAHAALCQLAGLGVGERAAIAPHDTILEPAGERVKEPAITNPVGSSTFAGNRIVRGGA